MADLTLGVEIAGHRVESVIGRGGMGVVYLAEHLRLGRKVALKVLTPQLGEDSVFKDRFVRESRLAALMDHPNIITIYDAGEVDSMLYISMRYVDGPDLRRLLRREGRLDVEPALSVCSQVASALDAAHQEGLVHRDVKPANVLLAAPRGEGGPERVFLSDFGITKRLGEGAVTTTGEFVGTINYVAPEQITGQTIDGRADVYSLGCLAYQCLTGELPYPHDDQLAVIYAHLQAPPPLLSNKRAEATPEADDVISRALAKSADQRFATCRELVDALADTLPGGTSAATRPILRPLPPPPLAPEPRRRRWRTVALVTGLVLLLGAGALIGFLLLREGGRTGGQTTGGAPGSGASGVPKWTRLVNQSVSVFGGPGNQAINRVIQFRSGLVGVGYDGPPGDYEPVSWTSFDGRTWQRHNAPSLHEPGDQGISGVVLGGPGLVAVGSDDSNDKGDGAVWTSPDGRSWRRIHDSSLGGSGKQSMVRAAVLGTDIFAVGYDTSEREGKDAAVWVSRSADGSSWEQLSSPTFRGPYNQEIRSVTRYRSTIVAVGETGSRQDIDAEVWTSHDDGRTWNASTSPDLAGPGLQVMLSVEASGHGLVAVGFASSGPNQDAAVWTSKNGEDWVQVPPQPKVLGGPGTQRMVGLTRWSDGLVGVGYSARREDLDAAVWISGNGETWQLTPASADFVSPGEQRIKAVIGYHSVLIAVGRETDRDEDAAVWIGRAAS